MRRDAMTNRRRHKGNRKAQLLCGSASEPLCTFTAWAEAPTLHPQSRRKLASTSIMIISVLLSLSAESRDASSTKTCFDDAVTNAVRALMPLQRTQLCKCLSDSSLPPRAIFARVCR